MEYPESYFEDEVRNGVFVSGTMKRSWAAQLEVLADIDKVCQKHNIQWFADCGTLLGAVRHKGFVPWDDDTDICMTRDNYLRFLAVAEEELPAGYHLLNYKTDSEFECAEYLTRVVNGKGINFDKAHLQKFHKFPYAVGVDIFPLDYLAMDSEEEEARIEVARIVRDFIAGIVDEDYLLQEHEQYLCEIEKLCRVKINREASVRQQLYALMEHIFGMYGKDEAEYVALMPYWIEKGNHKYSKDLFAHSIEVPFEHTKVRIPVMFDRVLRIEYGNYMRMVKDGGVHEYPFYRRQEDHLEYNCGIKLPKYYFSKEDLHRKHAVTRKGKLKELLNLIQVLSEVHDKIRAALHNMQQAEALQLLEGCQNGAITIGNVIEQLKGEGFCTVKLLEQYCEQVYQIHEELVQYGKTDENTVCQELQETLMQVKESIQKDIMERREVVFLPFKASAWSSFAGMWQAAAADPLCDVYVVPIPYYDREADSTFGDMHYDITGYPEYVSVTSCQEYRIEQRLPDVIIIHNPDDACSRVLTVHPQFYSKYLKEYTEQLVYTPYFVLEEFEAEDEKAYQNMEYYVTMPGVVHADTVIVQSENMKQLYVKKLTEFAGEDTRQVWENKILGIGSQWAPAQKNMQSFPAEWCRIARKADGSFKKVILYGSSLRDLLQQKERMLEKMQDVFRIFLENRDEVTVLWKPHWLTKTVLEQVDTSLYEQYCGLEQEFCEQAVGIMAVDEPDELAAEFCDAYYGDTSTLLYLCQKAEKPVMLQNCWVKGA